ncbi:hypothetical protein FOZG_13578 [Fusarium oxysporum Fo47]|uniref:Uncharacterized protein n=1 Tax=Fusarium oxysporum Fo47 TaxID=660027 RepID=W9JP93_FUSOX|nr:hypothetical protein FOZG_13578 [Fusarium oxysporum Fo47]
MRGSGTYRSQDKATDIFKLLGGQRHHMLVWGRG